MINFDFRKARPKQRLLDARAAKHKAEAEAARKLELRERAATAQELVYKMRSFDGKDDDKSDIHGDVVLDRSFSGFKCTKDGVETGEVLTKDEVNKRKPGESEEVRFETIDGVAEFDADGTYRVDASWRKDRAFWTSPDHDGEQFVRREKCLDQEWYIEGRRDGTVLYHLGKSRFHQNADGTLTGLPSEPTLRERLFGEGPPRWGLF